MPSKKKTRGKPRRVAKSKKAREEDAAAKNDDVDSQMQRLQIGKDTNNQDGDDDEDALLDEAIKLAAVEKEESEIAAKKVELETAAKNDEVCIHGEIPFPRGHVCIAFIENFWDAYYEVYHDSNMCTRLAKVHEATKVKWAKVWNDPDMMHWVVSDFLRAGTQGILHGEYDLVRHVATQISFLEQWVVIAIETFEIKAASKWDFFEALCDWNKIVEIFVADEHTLVSLFRKRIPCKCLDKRYEEVKSITKMGLCHNPRCSLPDRRVTRSKMLYCTHCRRTNYCSRECQVDDWPSHKTICDSYASMLFAQKSRHKITADVVKPSTHQNVST